MDTEEEGRGMQSLLITWNPIVGQLSSQPRKQVYVCNVTTISEFM